MFKSDSGFIVMRPGYDCRPSEPRRSWLEAAIMKPSSSSRDIKNSNEIAAMAREDSRRAYGKEEDWDGALRRISGGVAQPRPLALDFIITPKLEKIVKDDTAFLFELKRRPGGTPCARSFQFYD